MKQEYLRVCFNITPGCCKDVTFTATISEPIEKFIKRNNIEFKSITVLLVCKCSKQEYEFYKQFNPTNETYAKMKKEDYGKRKSS